jgi:hypothetical protein
MKVTRWTGSYTLTAEGTGSNGTDIFTIDEATNVTVNMLWPSGGALCDQLRWRGDDIAATGQLNDRLQIKGGCRGQLELYKTLIGNTGHPTSSSLTIDSLGGTYTFSTNPELNGTETQYDCTNPPVQGNSHIVPTDPNTNHLWPLTFTLPKSVGPLTANIKFRALAKWEQADPTPLPTFRFRFTLRPVIETGPLQFVPVTPCRVAVQQVGGGRVKAFHIQQSQCNIPSTASAYSLNVTATPSNTELGYLTIWNTGDAQPFVSTMNSPDGRTKANAAIVPAGNHGDVSVYVTHDATVTLDINGYFVSPANSTLAFYPVEPCRMVDTRNSLGGTKLVAGVEQDFRISGAPACSIPSTAVAYSLNVTAMPSAASDSVEIWEAGQPRTNLSTLKPYGTQMTVNAAIVKAGPQGMIAAYATQATDLVIDINGYFAPPGRTGLSLYTEVPCRIIDTRISGTPLSSSGTLPTIVNSSPCQPSKPASAYVLNATTLPKDATQEALTLWPDGTTRPSESILTSADGTLGSNMAIVQAGSNYTIDAFSSSQPPSSQTHLVLDLLGYFAP